MAITESRMTQLTGPYADLNKPNMLVGEMAVPSDHVPVVRNGVNSWEDISTVETMNDYIDVKTVDIVADLTADIDTAITGAENAASYAISTADNLEETYAPRLQNVEYATVKTDIALKDLAKTTKSVIPDVKVSTYSRSSLLSANAREGQMNVKISGNTMKNEVVNGNFSNGTTGWSTTYSSITASNNKLTDTADGTNANASTNISVPTKTTNRYYYKANIRVTNANCTQINIGNSANGYTIQLNPIQNQWYNMSDIKNGFSIVGNKLYVVHRYANSATALNKVMEVKDVICIDMGSDTSNPLYNKTVAEMDALTPYYFDGFSDVKTGVVRTVGKNLFNGIFLKGAYSSGTGIYIPGAASYICSRDKIRVKPSTSYSVSNNLGITSGDILQYTEDGSFIERCNLVGGVLSVNCAFIKINLYKASPDIFPIDITWSQVEQNSVATTYEPYTQTIKYLPYASLKSLNNGIRDYIDSSKYVKNISDVYSLQASDITAITNGTNLQYVTIPLTKFSGIKAQVASSVDGSTNVNGFYERATIDGIGQALSYVTDATNMYLQFALGTYANLTAAQTALIGTKIIYQLATPIITEILPNTVKSSPNGSVQYLNVRGEVGYYGTNIAVTNSALPIKSLTSVKKINIVDGSETNIDLATCTIASGGLTFTSTTLTSGDLVDWNYEFDSALSTTPLIDYEYQNGYNGNVVIGTTTLQIKGGIIIRVTQS